MVRRRWPPQYAENGLHKERRLDQPAIDKMRQNCRGVRHRSTRARRRVPHSSPSRFITFSISAKVLRKMKVREVISSALRLPVVFPFLVAVRASGYSPKFIDPMFIEHISGLARQAARRGRSSRVMP